MKLQDGKYELIHHEDYRFECLRHGEPWRDLTGDGMVFAMYLRIKELEKYNEELIQALKDYKDKVNWLLEDVSCCRGEREILEADNDSQLERIKELEKEAEELGREW